MRFVKRKYMFLMTSFIWACSAFAQSVPQVMNYQGRLTDGNGQPITGTRKLEFNVYNASTGGSLLWGPQSHDNVEFSAAGEFNVILGPKDSAIPTTRDLSVGFAGGNAFIGIKVGPAGGTVSAEISPRQQVLAAPYAFVAAKADSIPSPTWSKVSYARFMTNTSDTWLDVPGSSVKLTAVSGRPIDIMIASGGALSTGQPWSPFTGRATNLRFIRKTDGKVIGTMGTLRLSSSNGSSNAVALQMPTGCMRTIDLEPLVGENTYAIQVNNSSESRDGNPDLDGYIEAGTVVAISR